MFIEIKGVQFVNKGAELMLMAVLEQLTQILPDAKIVLDGNKFSPYQKRAKLGAYQKLSLRKNIIDLNRLTYVLPAKIRQYLLKWGIVTEADINVVLDASGFSYGDQWGSLKIKHLAGELTRYSKNKSKYIFLPQALGPFTRNADIKHLKNSLHLATHIFARDNDSLSAVKPLTNVNNVSLKPDFTNLVSGYLPANWQPIENAVYFIPNNKMISKSNLNIDWRNNYLRVFTSLIQATLNYGYTPVLLNHEGEGDKSICDNLNQQFNNQLQIIEENDPLCVKGIIGTAKAIVSSRYHGCISGLSQGIPTLATSWSHKYEALFEEYNVKDLVVEPNAKQEDLEQLFNHVVKSDALSINLEHAAQKFKKYSREMWSEVKVLIEE